MIDGLVTDINNTFVITPFKAQATQLVNKYGNHSCGTIHTFQGKDAKNVIFSTVLNDLYFCKKHIEGDYNLFTKELINVAVSRTKNKFVFVCDKKFFVDNKNTAPEVKKLN